MVYIRDRLGRRRWQSVAVLVLAAGLMPAFAGVLTAQEEQPAETQSGGPDLKEQLAQEKQALQQTSTELSQATQQLEKDVLTLEKELHAGRVKFLELQIALAEKETQQAAALTEAKQKKAELETALADLKKRVEEGTVTFTSEEARQARDQAKEAEAALKSAQATLTTGETELESVTTRLTRVRADAQATLKRAEEAVTAVAERKALAADDRTRALLDRQLAAERALSAQMQQMAQAVERQRELAKKDIEVAQAEVAWRGLANDLAQQQAKLAADFVTVTQKDIEEAAGEVEEKQAQAEEAKAEAEQVKEEVAVTRDELQGQLDKARTTLEKATTDEERAAAGKAVELLQQKLELVQTQQDVAAERASAREKEVKAAATEQADLEEKRDLEVGAVEEPERVDRAEQARRAAEEARQEVEATKARQDEVVLQMDQLDDRISKAKKDLDQAEAKLAQAPDDTRLAREVDLAREHLSILEDRRSVLMETWQALHRSIQASEKRAEAEQKRAQELGAGLWTRILDYLRSQYDSARRQAGRLGKKLVPAVGWIIFTIIACKIASVLVRAFFNVTGSISRRLQGLNLDVRRIDTVSRLIKSALSYIIYFAGFLFLLKKMEVNTTPVVAAVTGMLAVGVGFGSQNLVRDLVTGLFLLLEGQLVVGDFVDAGGSVGFVEEVGIRTTRIREIGGEVRILPNGRITAVRRFPKGYTEAQVDIFLAKNEDVPKAHEIVDDLAPKLDEELEVVLKVPAFVEVGNEGQPDVFLRYIIRTLPTQDWVAKTEFTNRVKAAFATAGIELNNNMIRIVFMTDVQVFRRRLGRFRRLVSQYER